MANLLAGLFGVLQGRIDHVPERDVQEVLATANAMRSPGKPALDAEDLRAFESAQVLYTTGRIIRQATPRPAQSAVQAVLGPMPGIHTNPGPAPAPPIPPPTPAANAGG